MENPVDYQFYTEFYFGNSIPNTDFPRLESRAGSQLERYRRSYRVEGDEEQQKLAICAMADALYYYESVANGGIASSCSVGSVSSSQATVAPDMSSKAQSAELYRCARQYLTIYRGAG